MPSTTDKMADSRKISAKCPPVPGDTASSMSSQKLINHSDTTQPTVPQSRIRPKSFSGVSKCVKLKEVPSVSTGTTSNQETRLAAKTAAKVVRSAMNQSTTAARNAQADRHFS